MNRVKTAFVAIIMAMSFASLAWTQGMRGGMGRQAPRLLGEFKPVVGSGAQYQMTTQNRTSSFSYAIVGKEDAEGGIGYWMEIRSQSAEMNGEMVMKQLLVVSGDKPQIKRMIMQMAGRPPMEMPVGMMQGMAHRGGGGSGDTSPGERVGSETITVPAGTFDCEHYRKQEPSGTTVDVWVSSKVSPYGTVKMTSGEMTMVLEKILTDEKSHIQGEPQKMNIPFPRQ